VYVRPRLPEYQLDFGPVILSSVERRLIAARNAGSCPVSFVIDQLRAPSVGFTVQLDTVAKLPPNDAVDIPVTFDPRIVNLDLGKIEETILINVCNLQIASFSSLYTLSLLGNIFCSFVT